MSDFRAREIAYTREHCTFSDVMLLYAQRMVSVEGVGLAVD